MPHITSKPDWRNLIKDLRHTATSFWQALQQNQQSLAGFRDTLAFAWTYRKLISRIIGHALSQQPSSQFKEIQRKLIRAEAHLIGHTFARFFKKTSADKITTVSSHDPRFKHQVWQKWPFFYWLHQSYLLFVDYAKECLQSTALAPEEKKQAEFLLELITALLAPCNFLFTNPELLQITWQQRGANLLHGTDLWLRDIIRWQGYFSFDKTDCTAFQVGVNLATTPGVVALRTPLMELIAYHPTTAQVHAYPILLVTTWINKYYLLDLQPHHSLVQWLINKGHPVFIVSWKNPSLSDAHFTFADYLALGPQAALNFLCQTLGFTKVHLVGYCLGGTLQACLAATEAAQKQNRIASLSLLASLLDYTDAGPLQQLLGETQIQFFERSMEKTGLFDARKMAMAFNLLKPAQLLWPYWVNYWKGRPLHKLDILYWGIDATHITAPVQRFYMRKLYLENALVQPNQIELNRVAINFGQLAIPVYMAAFQADHIAPWQSVFRSVTHLTHCADIQLTLGKGDHFTSLLPSSATSMAGFQSAPSKKLNSLTDLLDEPIQADNWLAHWQNWLVTHNPTPDATAMPIEIPQPVTKAPGDYVLQWFDKMAVK